MRRKMLCLIDFMNSDSDRFLGETNQIQQDLIRKIYDGFQENNELKVIPNSSEHELEKPLFFNKLNETCLDLYDTNGCVTRILSLTKAQEGKILELKIVREFIEENIEEVLGMKEKSPFMMPKRKIEHFDKSTQYQRQHQQNEQLICQETDRRYSRLQMEKNFHCSNPRISTNGFWDRNYVNYKNEWQVPYAGSQHYMYNHVYLNQRGYYDRFF